MAYKNIGNIPIEYKHKEREVEPIGLIKEPSLILKLYNMYIMDKPISSRGQLLNESREFLIEEVRRGRIDPLIGLGFSILSEDMLNVARWDAECPIVLKNQIYGYKNGDLGTAELLDIRDVGSFCIWELGIVNHERSSWKKYLESERKDVDKRQYVNSFCSTIFVPYRQTIRLRW